jgi:hypothetical protein
MAFTAANPQRTANMQTYKPFDQALEKKGYFLAKSQMIHWRFGLVSSQIDDEDIDFRLHHHPDIYPPILPYLCPVLTTPNA